MQEASRKSHVPKNCSVHQSIGKYVPSDKSECFISGDDDHPVQKWQEASPLRRWLFGQIEVIELEDGV